MPIRQFQAQRMHAPRDFQMISPDPLCVEIGAGKGKHALLFTANHPEKKLIAVERTREKFVAMQKQHGLEGQQNFSWYMPMPCRGWYMPCNRSKLNSSLFFIPTLNRIILHSAG